MAENTPIPQNNALQQARKFVGKLKLWQRILLFSVPIVIFASIVGIIATSGESKEEKMAVLFSELQPGDASSIMESLNSSNIEYELADNGTTIMVDKTIVDKTRLNLASEGLPATSIVGYELFDQTNLGMSEFVQKVNYRRALEGELAKTIGAMDEIKKVRVHIVIPEKTLFKEDQKEPSASVTLHMENGRSLSKISIDGIQTLVSSSVEGLMPDKVSVTDHRGNLLSSPEPDENSLAGKTALQHEQQRRIEKHLEEKAQKILDNALGVGNSKVQVTADLDFTRIEQTKTDFDPERQVVRSEQQIVEKSESTDSLSYPAVNMARDQSNNIQNYEISKTVEHIIHDVGVVKRLSVAAMINGDYKIVTNEEGIRSMEYIPRSEEEMNDLENLIKNAVGFSTERPDQISVVNVKFDTALEELAPEELNELPFYEKPENIRIFALIFVMLITIILMWRTLQNKYVKDQIRVALELPEKVDPDVTDEELDEDDEEEPEEELEELELDEDDLLLLPAELPEQLLLEGESMDDDEPEDLLEDEDEMNKEALADRARAALDDSEPPDIDEDDLMKIEIKSKVEQFADTETEEAVKLIRILIQDDNVLRF